MTKLNTESRDKTMYIFTSDPGHGWLRVLKTEIKPIQDKISKHSYMNGKYVYLEEDCDAGIFMLHKWGSYDEAHKHIKDNSVETTKIRSYEQYSPDTILEMDILEQEHKFENKP